MCRETGSGRLAFDVIETADALATRAPRPEVLALDIPIGLPDAGRRACDGEARVYIGPRRNSVFPAPIRPAVGAASREEASRITQRADGRRVGVQAWAIFPKIHAVDRALATSPDFRRAVREVHPEVCFWAWNGRVPMRWAKKRRAGLRERLELGEAWLGTGILERARGRVLKKDLADDDIVDAIAGLWTAHRIADGTAETLPAEPPHDAAGLPMEIVF